MPSEEQEGQRRELTGTVVGHCEICGLAVPVSELRELESGSPLAEHTHTPMICVDCWNAIERGEIDAETFLIEQDESDVPNAVIT